MTVHLWAIGGVYEIDGKPNRLTRITEAPFTSSLDPFEWHKNTAISWGLFTPMDSSRKLIGRPLGHNKITGPTHLPCPVCGELQQVADYGLSGHLELCWLRNEMKKEDLQTDFFIAGSRAPNAHDYVTHSHTFHSCGNHFRLIHRWNRTDASVPAEWSVCIKSNSQDSPAWRTLVGPFEDVNELLNVSWYAPEYRQALQLAVDAINQRDIQKKSENKSRNAENAGKTRQNCVCFVFDGEQYAIIRIPNLGFRLFIYKKHEGLLMFRKSNSLSELLSGEFFAAAMAAWQAENGNVEEEEEEEGSESISFRFSGSGESE